MLHLTKQERSVVFVLAAVLLAGTTMDYALKRFPHLKNILNFSESPELYHKVDLNTATYEELTAIPYIGDYTARQIIDRRLQEGDFSSVEQVLSVKGIRPSSYKIFSKYLKASPPDRRRGK